MTSKNTHGGAGRGQGNKPLADESTRSVQFNFYTQRYKIDAIGKDKLKTMCIELVDKEFKKLKK